MKKLLFIFILMLTLLNLAYSTDTTIEFKPVIGIVNQFNNQNIISSGFNIQFGAQFNFDTFSLGLFADTSITTGYPYGLEYHIGGSLEFGIQNIYFGLGYYLFGNAFPMIKGTGFGSDYYNLHSLRLHTVLANTQLSNFNLRLMPYISMYFDPFEKHTTNLIKIDEHKFGFGIIISLSLEKKQNNNIPVITYPEINYQEIIEIELQKETEVIREHIIEAEVEKEIFIEIEKEITIENIPPLLYDKNGWFLHYDTETGNARWIHNPDLSKVRYRLH